MPVTVVQVLSPAGRIEPDLFPTEGDGADGSDLHARLTAYITEAVAKTADEEAQAAWVYHRAFDAACDRLSALPAQVNQNDAGGHSYTQDQRKRICSKADEWLAEYRRIVDALAAEEDDQEPPERSPRTRSVATSYGW